MPRRDRHTVTRSRTQRRRDAIRNARTAARLAGETRKRDTTKAAP